MLHVPIRPLVKLNGPIKTRFKTPKLTHCKKHGHPLTPENVYIDARGRRCRRCKIDSAIARKKAKRAIQ